MRSESGCSRGLIDRSGRRRRRHRVTATSTSMESPRPRDPAQRSRSPSLRSLGNRAVMGACDPQQALARPPCAHPRLPGRTGPGRTGSPSVSRRGNVTRWLWAHDHVGCSRGRRGAGLRGAPCSELAESGIQRPPQRSGGRATRPYDRPLRCPKSLLPRSARCGAAHCEWTWHRCRPQALDGCRRPQHQGPGCRPGTGNG